MDAKPLSRDELADVFAILRNQDAILGQRGVERLWATFAALESRVAELEKVRDLLAQRTQFEAAWRIANEERHDYGLACYMLRDLELSKADGLSDMLWALHNGGGDASKGDWELVRDSWDKAYREAIAALRSADEAQLARDNAKETC